MLTGIFTAISAITELFGVGQKVYEAVSGKSSTATTPEQLQAEVEQLPADKQAVFIAKMQAEIDMYQAQTARLQNEQGEITDALLDKVTPEVAGKIAWLRMSTRPRIAWLMTHVVALPFYVVLMDGGFILINWGTKVLGGIAQIPLLAGVFVDKSSPYLGLYEQAAWPATTIVLGYMTLTEIGKARGGKDAADVGVKDIVSSVGGAVGAVRDLFKKK